MPEMTQKLEDYNLVIKHGNEAIEVSAPTIPEALAKVKLAKIMGKISVTVTHGNLHTEQLLKAWYFKKLLISNDYKLLFEKRAKQFLGELKG